MGSAVRKLCQPLGCVDNQYMGLLPGFGRMGAKQMGKPDDL